jgi:hypothetical protein
MVLPMSDALTTAALKGFVRKQVQVSQRREETLKQEDIHSSKNRKIYKYSSGTDGCRVLCRQFSTSSLSLPVYSIKRCSTCWLKMKKPLREVILLL